MDFPIGGGRGSGGGFAQTLVNSEEFPNTPTQATLVGADFLRFFLKLGKIALREESGNMFLIRAVGLVEEFFSGERRLVRESFRANVGRMMAVAIVVDRLLVPSPWG
jgi:hypothetical protein